MLPNFLNIKKPLGSLLFVLMISSCAPAQRSGMVVDPETGLQFGSIVEKILLSTRANFQTTSLKFVCGMSLAIQLLTLVG